MQAAVCGGALYVSQTTLFAVQTSSFRDNCACATLVTAAAQPGLAPGGGACLLMSAWLLLLWPYLELSVCLDGALPAWS